MKHILILGTTGMLGSAVTKKLTGVQKYRVTATCRESAMNTLREVLPDSPLCHRAIFDPEAFVNDPAEEWPLFDDEPFDFVVNCIGIIKPNIAKVGVESTVRINSLFPHVLARFCYDHQIGLIHITTDCVYRGDKGSYIETDPHDCDDVYGKSKSLGEPFDRAMVLRTSIIGPEVHNYTSLVSWAKSQAGKHVNGFTNHKWNGVTTATYGDVIDRIITEQIWTPGLFHLYSPQSMTKFELLQEIDRRYELHLNINPKEAPVAVDRTLTSVHGFCGSLNLPDLDEQIRVM